jgi:hypothetical protein
MLKQIKEWLFWLLFFATVGMLIGAGLGFLARREMQGWI